MKIKMTVTVTMDEAQVRDYCDEYGLAPLEVERDTRSMVATILQGCRAGRFWAVTVNDLQKILCDAHREGVQCEVPVDLRTGRHMGSHATYRTVNEIARVWDGEE